MSQVEGVEKAISKLSAAEIQEIANWLENFFVFQSTNPFFPHCRAGRPVKAPTSPKFPGVGAAPAPKRDVGSASLRPQLNSQK